MSQYLAESSTLNALINQRLRQADVEMGVRVEQGGNPCKVEQSPEDN